MTAPHAAPIMARREEFAELRVATDDSGGIALTIGRPDCHGAPDEYALTVEQTVDLSDRLVHTVAEVRGITRLPGAGPLSSTY